MKVNHTMEVVKRVTDILLDQKSFEKYIRHEDNKWCVYSADGSKKLGCHDTKEDAVAQLAAIEANKVSKAHEHYAAVAGHLEEALAAETLEAAKEHINLALQAMGPEEMMEEEEYEKNVKKSTLTISKDAEGNPTWEMNVEFAKLDDEERLVCGIVYEPDVIDSQGDSAGPAEIKKAAHRFMQESKTLGVMHKEDAQDRASIVESFIMPENMRLGNQVIRKGSWVMVVKVHDDGLWSGIKKGKITGFSMSGRARNGEKA